MLDSIQFTNWMIKYNSQEQTGAHRCSVILSQRDQYVPRLSVRLYLTERLDSWLQARRRTHFGMKWFSLWNMTECTSHSDSSVIETKCCFWWCGAIRPTGSKGSPACNLVFLLLLCTDVHHFTSLLLNLLRLAWQLPCKTAQHRRMDAAPLVFLSYCWSRAWARSSSLKPS